MSPACALRAGLGFALLAFGSLGCFNAYPQRVPGPLFLPDEQPASRATALPSGIVTLQRDSDPVWVRRPGERGEYPLPFYRKRERVPFGADVRTGAGGRAEVLWAPDATSLALFDACHATLGDPERDEPTATLHAITRAILVLTPEDRIELAGGAILAGDPLELTGTVLLERAPGSVLRVINQSKRLVTIAFRSERLELAPGESLDLPLLARGASPVLAEAEPERVEGGGLSVEVRGKVEHEDRGQGLRLSAGEPARVRALGVEATLAPGESVLFSGLSQVGRGSPADPTVQP